MEIKDYITLVFSLIALSLSLIALRQKKYETERAVRTQLTDAMGKLNLVAAEKAKVKFENADKLTSPHVQAMLFKLNEQNRFLGRQATYLIEQIPSELLSDIE